MKVTCEYCDSYVDVDENMKCPLCGGPLGGAVLTEQKRAIEAQEAEAQRAAEEAEREAEAKAQEAKENHISEVIAGITSVATAFVAGKTSDDDDEPARPEGKPPLPHEGHPEPGHHHKPEHEIMDPQQGAFHTAADTREAHRVKPGENGAHRHSANGKQGRPSGQPGGQPGHRHR